MDDKKLEEYRKIHDIGAVVRKLFVQVHQDEAKIEEQLKALADAVDEDEWRLKDKVNKLYEDYTDRHACLECGNAYPRDNDYDFEQFLSEIEEKYYAVLYMKEHGISINGGQK